MNEKCEKIKNQDCNGSKVDPVDNSSKSIYVSNGNCCLQGTMWSVLDQKCIPIVDPFCLESNQEGQCSKCMDKYSFSVDTDKQSLPVVNYSFVNFNELVRCPKIQRSFKYHSCVPDAIASNANIYTYDKIYLKVKYCGEFDIVNTKKCTKCLTTAYMADSVSGICCPKGQILINDLCQKTTQIDIINNCYSFDVQNKVCLKCKSGYHLSSGKCCAEGYYVNPYNKKCEHYYPDCANFLEKYAVCDRCYPGYYMSQGKCCQFGTRWVKAKQTCEAFQESALYGCSKGASETYCQQCVSE